MNNDLRISSAAVSERGLSDKRPQNEDSFLAMPQIGIFAVADGVGGANAGEVASQMAVEILADAFSHLSPSSDAETAMLAAMEQANSSIFQMAHELPQLASMATTVAALHLNGNIATIGHVGDSRVYRVDPGGNIFRETDDHSVVAEEVRAGRMTEEQAENHPSKNVISRALGAEGTVQPDLKTIMVEPGTSFLLCSDGITRHVSDAEIRRVLSQENDLDEVCSYLKDLVYDRGAEDNMTAVAVRVGDHVALAEMQTDEMPSLDTMEAEEATVATARQTSPFESKADDDEDLLELETSDLKPLVTNDTILHSGTTTAPVQPESPEARTVEIGSPAAKDQTDAGRGVGPQSGDKEPAAIEADTSEVSNLPGGRGFGLGSFVVGLLAGAAIAFGVYYFVLFPKPAQQQPQTAALTEMRTANIPLSSFEENRRNVDRDPSGWISRFGTNPEDCEDFYLLGRAYFMTGDFDKARTALERSRDLLPSEDPVSQKTIAADIATALVALTGTTSQTMVKKELEMIRPTANANTASNANAAANSTINR